MNVYPFIEAEEEEQRNVSTSCELFEVSRSAYYVWAAHCPSPQDLSDLALEERIVEIHTASRGTYGAPRVHAELADHDIACGRKRVARIMRRKGLVGVSPRRYKTTTIADPAADPIADLVKRAFGPDTVELDSIYCGDITYIRTWEGWLYLATVIDLGSRRVVGWSMADHMRAELVCDALGHRAPPPRRPDLPLRPGIAVHLRRVRLALRGPGRHAVHEPARPVLGQRGFGELLRQPEKRIDLTPGPHG